MPLHSYPSSRYLLYNCFYNTVKAFKFFILKVKFEIDAYFIFA